RCERMHSWPDSASRFVLREQTRKIASPQTDLLTLRYEPSGGLHSSLLLCVNHAAVPCWGWNSIQPARACDEISNHGRDPRFLSSRCTDAPWKVWKRGRIMRKFLLAGALAVGLPATASAADLPMPPAPVVAPVVYSWTGCYIGGNVGGVWRGGDNWTDARFGIGFGDGNNNNGRFIAGGQVGCNYQFNHFVL